MLMTGGSKTNGGSSEGRPYLRNNLNDLRHRGSETLLKAANSGALEEDAAPASPISAIRFQAAGGSTYH